MNSRTNIIILILTSLLYFVAIRTNIGRIIFMPIERLVAFLHEFGHASMAILTGGYVNSMQVNSDGSGVTYTTGGNGALITMGGYIGSCLFSNLIVRSSLSNFTKQTCEILAAVSIVTSILWYSSLSSAFILISYGLLFIFISRIPLISPLVLQFVGIACVVHILNDFDVGPSSDLAAFQEDVGILSYSGWMYTWLAIAVLITLYNLKSILIVQKNEDLTY